MHMIQVAPQAVGWSVSGCFEPQFFASGACAERAGRRLAQALAQAGESVELLIADRSGHLAGRVRVDPRPEFAHPEFARPAFARPEFA